MLENDCGSLLLGNPIMVLLLLSRGHEQQATSLRRWGRQRIRQMVKKTLERALLVFGIIKDKTVSLFTFNSSVLINRILSVKREKNWRHIWNVYYECMCIHYFANEERKRLCSTILIQSMDHTLNIFFYITSKSRISSLSLVLFILNAWITEKVIIVLEMIWMHVTKLYKKNHNRKK